MTIGIYSHSLSLLTDFYQLSMAYAYWKAGLDQREAVFHLFFRKRPFSGGFTIAAGLESVIQYLNQFKFQDSDLAYLKTLNAPSGKKLFEDNFLEYLKNLKFSCDVEAIPEGTVVFPYEPLIRVRGPLLQCQLLETPLLNLINYPTLIATKAARVCIAAQDDPVFEFGLRRAQGIDGGMTASRSAFIGGCYATSNVLAGKIFHIPVAGTHSHSWIMVFEEELDAFRTFAKYLPETCVFLVDTYDSLCGVKHAIIVARELKEHGHSLIGIRLDSGDLAYLSIEARRLLDEAGFTETQIYASNELDEVIISELKRQGAKIKVWGVGTHLVTGGKDQAALDGVYKLSAIKGEDKRWHYKLKLSEQMLKISNPGILQVRRFSLDGEYIADAIYDEGSLKNRENWHLIDPLEPFREKIIPQKAAGEDLLIPIIKNGKQVYSSPPLEEIRKRTKEQLSKFPTGIKRFLNPHQFIVGMEKSTQEMKTELIKKARQKVADDSSYFS